MRPSRIAAAALVPIALLVGLVFADCTPAPMPPVVPDAMTEAGCGTIDKANAARLIRAPDGSALYTPCDAGSRP